MKRKCLEFNMSAIAIIPARGGSKGISKKNIKPLLGQPLISWAIESLQKSSAFDDIVVSSDDVEILKVAENCGATAYLRAEPMDSTDYAMPDLPCLSYLNSLSESQRPEYAFMVQCTTPLIRPQTYAKAADVLRKLQEGTVFASVEDHSFLWRGELQSSDDNFEPLGHDKYSRLGRQYLDYKQVKEIGAFYGFDVKGFLKSRHRFYDACIPVLIDQSDAVDIDNMTDWELAETKLRARRKKEGLL